MATEWKNWSDDAVTSQGTPEIDSQSQKVGIGKDEFTSIDFIEYGSNNTIFSDF